MASTTATRGKADTVVIIRARLRAMGGDAEARFLKMLPPETAAVYGSALPLTWVPSDYLTSIVECGARVLFPDDPDPARRLGQVAGTAGYTGMYRVLIRVATIPYLMGKAPNIWKNHYTAGKLSVEETGERSLLLSVHDFPDMSTTLRDLASGYYIALCELTGAEEVKVIRDDRPPVWRWIVTWS